MKKTDSSAEIDLSSDTANIHLFSRGRNLETVADLSSFDGSADASNGGQIDIGRGHNADYLMRQR